MAKATTAAPTGRNNNTTTNNSNKSKTTNNTTTATSRNVNNANITSPKGTTTEQPPGSKFTFLFAFLVAVIGVAVYMLLSISPYDPVEFETFGIDGINPSEQDITHWELGKQIGKGGYSRVFLGRRKTQPGTNLLLPAPNSTNPKSIGNERYDHAIKIIPKARYFRQSMDPTSKKMSSITKDALYNAVWSERNAWVAFSLPKPIPYVLPLSHIFQDRHALYYIIPLINGGDLDRSLNMFGPMNEHTVRYYAASIITALEGMHARGYVYKDIKLKNLLLDEEGRLQMTDFGLTRSGVQNAGNPSQPTNCVTNGVTGRAGTKSYKAPEILSGTGHSYPSDFYALGVVLYKMLTAHKLYHSDHELPRLSHYLRIPKYHHYVLRHPKWRAYGVYDFFSKVQKELQQVQQGEQESSGSETLDVLNYQLQRDFMTFQLNELLNRDFKDQAGMKNYGKDNTAGKKGRHYQQGQNDENDENDENTNENDENDDPSDGNAPSKFTPSELFVDGVGPIFGPDDAREIQQAQLNGKVSNSKGNVKGRLAWLSLTDDAIDLLTQMTDLNAFYRIGTANRRLRDYDPLSYNGNWDRSEDSGSSSSSSSSSADLRSKHTIDLDPSTKVNNIFHPQTGSIVSINSDATDGNNDKHQFNYITQDYKHTDAALLSMQEFSFQRDVIPLAKSTPPSTHCFELHQDVTKALPSFLGKDSNGKWRGLHSGFVEIKNHPWFKNFDWDLMTDIIINPNDTNTPTKPTPGHQHIQFESVDVKNYDKNDFPPMIDAKDDHFDEKWQGLFKGLDFSTRL